MCKAVPGTLPFTPTAGCLPPIPSNQFPSTRMRISDNEADGDDHHARDEGAARCGAGKGPGQLFGEEADTRGRTAKHERAPRLGGPFQARQR